MARILSIEPKRIAPFASFLMTPLSLAAYTLALWRMGSDLDWTSDFLISKGLFSHWQVWLAVAILAQASGHRLNKMGRPDQTLTS